MNVSWSALLKLANLTLQPLLLLIFIVLVLACPASFERAAYALEVTFSVLIMLSIACNPNSKTCEKKLPRPQQE
jgi:hypothetical protein